MEKNWGTFQRANDIARKNLCSKLTPNYWNCCALKKKLWQKCDKNFLSSVKNEMEKNSPNPAKLASESKWTSTKWLSKRNHQLRLSWTFHTEIPILNLEISNICKLQGREWKGKMKPRSGKEVAFSLSCKSHGNVKKKCRKSPSRLRPDSSLYFPFCCSEMNVSRQLPA